MHVLYIRPYAGELERLAAAAPEHTWTAAPDIATLDDATRAAAEVLSVFVDYEVTGEELALLPNVRFIATRSAGYNHIDMAAVVSRGIVVSRVPHYGARTVAEYAIALMFALSRSAFRSYTDMLQRSSLEDLERYEGFDLFGKTLGVVGTGMIGRSVCEIARGIGMTVVATDEYPDQVWAKTIGVTYVDLPTLLGQSDLVSLHVPALPSTHHLIGATELAQMKPGSYLINTARGEVVDTRALVAALQSGHLAGAGLDVLEGEHALREEVNLLIHGGMDASLWETLVADHALIDMPNVIVTPHIAFNTIQAKREITDITLQNINAFITEPINIVPHA